MVVTVAGVGICAQTTADYAHFFETDGSSIPAIREMGHLEKNAIEEIQADRREAWSLLLWRKSEKDVHVGLLSSVRNRGYAIVAPNEVELTRRSALLPTRGHCSVCGIGPAEERSIMMSVRNVGICAGCTFTAQFIFSRAGASVKHRPVIDLFPGSNRSGDR